MAMIDFKILKELTHEEEQKIVEFLDKNITTQFIVVERTE